MNPSSTRRDATPRRGMLLLLVLSILSLFIVIGAVGILLALRARETARAFAAASTSQVASGPLARAQLDEALLRLVRGTTTVGGPVTESLLADKYGTSLSGTGTVTAISGTSAAFLTVTVAGSLTDTVTGSSTTVAAFLGNPAAVAGRVLTFVPAAADPTGPTSYRILRTGTAPNTLLLANLKPNTPVPLPTVFPCDVVINGREFSGTQSTDRHESYDAFDADPAAPVRNPFLTWPVLQSSTISSVRRAAFGALNDPTKTVVDNDGDGVADGVWLTDALPRQRTASGGELQFDVSYLVLDLDGRINLNAHGSFVRAQLPQDSTQYPKDPGACPVGMGFGPADVDAALAVGGSGTTRWALLVQGGSATRTATTSTAIQWRPTPLVETTQPGRYTQGTAFSSAAPGNSGLTTGTSLANADYWMLNPAGNSPTDLKARLQVFTVLNGGTPTLQFCRPAGATAWAAGTDTDDLRSSGTASHPYALRLDEDAPRAAGGNAIDAPYTVGELERILRPFDADAATLAPRLAAMLDELAERSRLTVTTDSWDTPAITGTAVTRTGTAVTGGNAYAVLSPETVAGLRFNLNRPLAGAAARQEYFRQLYSLMVALTGTASSAEAAQWAANVVEFRDPDSIMGWYPYDPNPLDGAWTTGTGVWGMERPELVITSASSSNSQVTVSLYRPWNAQLCTGPAATVSGTTERIDASLGDAAANTLNAAAAVGGAAVWQLKATVATGGTTAGLNTALPSATAMPANSGTSATVTTSGAATEIVLQRLANPGAARNPDSTSAAYNDYVDIHRLAIPAGGSTPQRNVSRWLHWPNRDLVSNGELLAVPSGDPASMPEACFDESKESALARTAPLILEATIVPSLFAGANGYVASGTTFLAGTGFENFSYGQFSRWREAGRVNVNTILPNAGNTPAALNDAVWTALVGLSGTANPVTAGGANNYAPIMDLPALLTGRFERSGNDSASAFLKRATAIRLANCATTRSHVFAVWITLRVTDSSPNAGAPQFARLFAIVDRSIPVGYMPGRTLNVRETIRLQRYLP